MNDLQQTEQLYQLIVEQRAILLELRRFAATQYEIVQRNELGKLVSLLANKQKAINRLTQIDKSLEAFRHHDPEARVWASQEQREECRKLAKECPGLLADVMTLEQAAENQLREKREQVADQFEQTSARSQAASAYLHNVSRTETVSRWSVEEGD